MRISITKIAAAALLLSGAAAHAEVNIGLIGPFTGGSAPMGESMRAGARVAVAELNAHGGVNGEKVNLIERDDQAMPERGPTLALELIKSEKVSIVVGFANTGVAKPALPKFQENKVPLIIAVATGVPLTKDFAGPDNYIFRMSANDIIQTSRVIAAAKAQGFKNPCKVVDKTPYGTFGSEQLDISAKAAGMAFVGNETFAIGDKDMTPQLLKCKAAGADVIIPWGIGPELAVIAKNRTKIGLKVPMIGGWTLSMSNYIELAGKDAEGTIMPSTFLQFSAKGDKQTAFAAAVAKELGNPMISSGPAAAQGYDSVMVAAAAINQAKSTEGPKIKAALESLQQPVEGIIQTYKAPYSASNHEAQTNETTGMGVIKGGKAVMLAK